MIMEKNVKAAHLKQTKHIKIGYFAITDKIKPKGIDIAYHPREAMQSDVSTKPIQGEKFHQMRAHLMDCPIDYHEGTNSKMART